MVKKDLRVLIYDSCPSSALRNSLLEILEGSFNLDTHIFEGGPEFCVPSLLGNVQHFKPELIVLSLSSKNLKNIDTQLDFIRKKSLDVPVIAVLDKCNPDDVITLLKLGTSDFITTPLKGFDIIPRIWRLVRSTGKDNVYIQSLKEKLGLRNIIGQSEAFLKELRKIPLVAKTNATVLLCGETGSGKDLFSHAIHFLSDRANKPFIPVNCGALPGELIESELFGHTRGAFTGAVTEYGGLINNADEGTLFLDEIDCLPVAAQAKLLRFLQHKEYRQLGSSKVQTANVRIIAAANSNLKDAIKEGRLRKDFCYRLNIIPFNLPPLRERRGDIALLAHHFIDKYASEYNKEVNGLTPDALEKLAFYSWPGNTRELEHTIERSVVLIEDTIIRSSDITFLEDDYDVEVPMSFKDEKNRVVTEFEKEFIVRMLTAFKGNISRASKAAEKHPRAFRQLIRKHHIDVQRFKAAT